MHKGVYRHAEYDGHVLYILKERVFLKCILLIANKYIVTKKNMSTVACSSTAMPLTRAFFC